MTSASDVPPTVAAPGTVVVGVAPGPGGVALELVDDAVGSIRFSSWCNTSSARWRKPRVGAGRLPVSWARNRRVVARSAEVFGGRAAAAGGARVGSIPSAGGRPARVTFGTR